MHASEFLTLISRGADDVGIDPDRLSCDCLTFEMRIKAGQLDEALALYRGDLLESFHVDSSAEFDAAAVRAYQAAQPEPTSRFSLPTRSA